MNVRTWRSRIVEYVRLDSWLFSRVIAAIGLGAGLALWIAGKRHAALRHLTRVHRARLSPLADRLVESFLRAPAGGPAGGRYARVLDVYRSHAANFPRSEGVVSLFDNPAAILGSRAAVLKSPRGREKGVLLIDYNFAFPMFARFFDVPRIAEKYHFVLEPSWSGFCDLDILCYAQFDFPVFVEASEPRDARFLEGNGAHFTSIPIASNWWVDHRTFRPLTGVRKDIDLVMLASWAPFKRHERFFAALARLAARGHRPRVLLVGYPYQTTLDQIMLAARHHGVDGQIETKENLSPEQVNDELNRSKVSVVWSRREGVNRAIIEGMCADVPCILREGFNYGYAYPYVNEHTGCYANEDTLPDRILEMIERSTSMRPRDWVMENMTCQLATRIIGDAIGRESARRGEPWTDGLAVKVCHLQTMRYWDDGDQQRFTADYEFLRQQMK